MQSSRRVFDARQETDEHQLPKNVEVAEELRQDRGLRERVMANYTRRLKVCLERDGGQVKIR